MPTIHRNSKLRTAASTLILIFVVGCATGIPKDVLKLPPENLAARQLQTRRYETNDERQILSACAGLLQDLGYAIEESETKLGLVVAYKDRDATSAGQVAGATLLTVLAALGGTYSNAYETIDDVQKIRAAVVTSPSSDGHMKARVTFQRIVWNKRGDVSRMETISDAKLYEEFFDRLSKSVFLESEKI